MLIISLLCRENAAKNLATLVSTCAHTKVDIDKKKYMNQFDISTFPAWAVYVLVAFACIKASCLRLG